VLCVALKLKVTILAEHTDMTRCFDGKDHPASDWQTPGGLEGSGN
jgi:hypothetical protein